MLSAIVAGIARLLSISSSKSEKTPIFNAHRIEPDLSEGDIVYTQPNEDKIAEEE